MSDLICRQAAIDALRKLREEDIEDYGCEIPEGFNQDHLDRATFAIKQLPSVQPEIKQQAINSSDCIDRRAALDAIRHIQTYKLFEGDDMLLIDKAEVQTELMMLPSAQLDTYWKEQCQSYEQTINKLRESLSTQPEIILCKDCDWWTKQEASLQGRCALMGMYPTGGWFCGNARKREVTE